MIKTCFKINFSCDYRNRKMKLDSIHEYLKNEIPELSEDELCRLQVIYNELITNAIVHGNKLDFSKKVELVVEIEENTIVSTIRDEGIGFDRSELFRPRRFPDEMYHMCGRGLMIVLGLADYVTWNDRGNEVMFLKNIHC